MGVRRTHFPAACDAIGTMCSWWSQCQGDRRMHVYWTGALLVAKSGAVCPAHSWRSRQLAQALTRLRFAAPS